MAYIAVYSILNRNVKSILPRGAFYSLGDEDSCRLNFPITWDLRDPYPKKLLALINLILIWHSQVSSTRMLTSNLGLGKWLVVCSRMSLGLGRLEGAILGVLHLDGS